MIVLLLILRLGDALNVGFEQFLLQRDAVGRDAAEVLDTFVYYTLLDRRLRATAPRRACSRAWSG